MDFLDIEAQASSIEAVLEIDTYDTNSYGNQFNGATNDTGTLTFAFDEPEAGFTLNVTGYDIDDETEVAVYVNGSYLANLAVTENNAEGFNQFHIDGEMLQDGTNSLTFVHLGSPTLTWGVTDILIQDQQGGHDLPFSWDPEYHEDGYVVWQVNGDGFYIGEMDMDTGAFVGVINYLDVPPIPWTQTIQAVEIIETVDGGVAAIGMSNEGLIYLSTTEGYVLEGTEGMRITALPKGELETLRFIAFDGTGQYIYEDGTLTELQIGANQAFQWLNESEVLLRNEFTDVTSILNIETMEQEVVTDIEYNSGQAAAFTMSNGDEYIALQGDGYNDIYTNTGDGWVFMQRMVNPFIVGDQFWSPEFFEWNGGLYVTGFVADSLDQNADAIVVTYDVTRDSWTRISGVEAWKDPEALVLNDGSLAYYADKVSDGSQNYSTISYARAILRSTPNGELSDENREITIVKEIATSEPFADRALADSFESSALADSFDFLGRA